MGATRQRNTTDRPSRRLPFVAAAALAAALGVAAPTSAGHDGAIHTDNIRVVDHDPFAFGTDIAFDGNRMVAGAATWTSDDDAGIRLYNAGNAAKLNLQGIAHCSSWHADVDFVGSSYVVQSHDSASDNHGCDPGSGREGIRVFDVSSPSNPASVGFAETVHGSHNLTAVAGTGLVYNSSYDLGDPAAVDGVSIVDVWADPIDPPVTFLEFPDVDNSPAHPDMHNRSGQIPTSPGCHDIGTDLERGLAFCAGITETHIWDVSDPSNPAIIAIIVNPAINIHHGALANADGDILVIGDEWAGAAGGPTACLIPDQPAGALWFYDISDPRNPRLLSYWSPPQPEPTADFCTAHFFDTFDDRDWVVSSWYDHGLYVVDFTDPHAPTMEASYDPGNATYWSARAERGFIYANSFAPATLTGEDPSKDGGGLWMLELDGYTRSDG